ncbi:Mbov_0396 family ICE element transmembrane protein [Mycoplasma anserisalpingitidis]|uniref:Mbov_0396 family ICE element transmembrane protein n=1 Tax=Mycoplasma anserisalpingitidis TaxID=519450 RepID=UPI0011B11C8A|nr:hypothetical protein [Mycoplasma anserisalpingitidis]QDY87721.1 hypothetical protein FOY45_02165 [Mycoplasma anserisalpingitidis]
MLNLDWIFYLIFSAFWSFIVLCLNIIDGVYWVFSKISFDFIGYFVLKINPNSGFNSDLQPPILFYKFLITSLIFIVFFSAYNLFKAYSSANPKRHYLRDILKGLIMHICFILCITLGVSTFLHLIKLIFSMIIPQSKEGGLASVLFYALKPTEINELRWLNMEKNGFYIDYDTYTMISGAQLFFIGILVVAIPMIILCIALIGAAGKVLEIGFLFIISPWISASSMIDNNQRLNLWCKLFFSKVVSLVFYLISMEVYAMFITSANSFAELESNFWNVLLLKAVLFIGSAVALSNLSNIIVSFFGEKLSAAESMREIAGISKLATGAFGAVKGAKAAAITGGLSLVKGGVAISALNKVRKQAAPVMSKINQLHKNGKISFGNSLKMKMSALSNAKNYVKGNSDSLSEAIRDKATFSGIKRSIGNAFTNKVFGSKENFEKQKTNLGKFNDSLMSDEKKYSKVKQLNSRSSKEIAADIEKDKLKQLHKSQTKGKK